MTTIKPKLYFVTENTNKFNEANEILQQLNCKYQLVQLKLDLPELQGTSDEISYQKALKAEKLLRTAGYSDPFIIDDTGLHYNCLGGMPGPYIKWFLKAVGCDGLSKLSDSFDDKTAYAQCVITVMMNDINDPVLLRGIVNGTIVQPRGQKSFGWDPVFEPFEEEGGNGQTYGEMSEEYKNGMSHRFKALKLLVDYLNDV